MYFSVRNNNFGSFDKTKIDSYVSLDSDVQFGQLF